MQSFFLPQSGRVVADRTCRWTPDLNPSSRISVEPDSPFADAAAAAVSDDEGEDDK